MRRFAPEVWVLVICTKEAETAKAILLNAEDEDGEFRQAWVPKSQIRKYNTTDNQISSVVMKEWIAADKEFAYTMVDANGDQKSEDSGARELTGQLDFDSRKKYTNGSKSFEEDDEIPF